VAELFEMKITASGEVRDAQGNLVEQVPIEQTVTLTREQVEALVAEQEES
jgi:hypothetical protein